MNNLIKKGILIKDNVVRLFFKLNAPERWQFTITNDVCQGKLCDEG